MSGSPIVCPLLPLSLSTGWPLPEAPPPTSLISTLHRRHVFGKDCVDSLVLYSIRISHVRRVIGIAHQPIHLPITG